MARSSYLLWGRSPRSRVSLLLRHQVPCPAKFNREIPLLRQPISHWEHCVLVVHVNACLKRNIGIIAA